MLTSLSRRLRSGHTSSPASPPRDTRDCLYLEDFVDLCESLPSNATSGRNRQGATLHILCRLLALPRTSLDRARGHLNRSRAGGRRASLSCAAAYTKSFYLAYEWLPGGSTPGSPRDFPPHLQLENIQVTESRKTPAALPPQASRTP